jgi:hypothetical protein
MLAVRFVRESSESEMVAVFLCGELTSDRFGPQLRRVFAHVASRSRS